MSYRGFDKVKFLIALSTIFSLVLYYLIAYQLERTDFFILSTIYLGLFINFIWFLKITKDNNFNLLLWFGIGFRFLFIFSIPTLSNDFYRFIWDGNLISEGLNPYSYLPSELIEREDFRNSGFYDQLYTGMGNFSQNNYTNYPPLNQILFWLPSVFTKNITIHIIFYRLIMIGADIGTFIIGRRILKSLKLNEKNILYYFLNPFIIIELTGNLHFESVMIFFLVLSFYFLGSNKQKVSSVFLAFSVLIKLVPLIFLPLIIRKAGIKNGLVFSIITGIIVFTSYIPFINPEFTGNYLNSLNLYFQKFEFNASIYYIVREVGYMVKGYNIIQTAGPVLSIISTALIIFIALLQKKDNPQSFYPLMMFGLLIYYLFATTVHPWYLSVLLIVSVFTKYRFVLVWTFVIILSYYTYSSLDFKENLWLNIIEYSIVLGFLVFEVIYLRRRKKYPLQLF